MGLRELVPALPITIADAQPSDALVFDDTGRARNRRLAFWDITWSGAVAYPTGTAYASMTDSSAAIIAAHETAKSLGVKLVGAGTYRVDTTVTIDQDADLGGASFVCSDNTISPLVRIGTSTSDARVEGIEVIAPKCYQMDKVIGAGWPGSDTGVEISNLYASRVTIPWVENFHTNVRETAYGMVGCVYNTITIGHLRNGLVNYAIAPTDTGWVAENVRIGGRFEHRASEGTNITGCRQILISDALETANNHLFIKPSLEGDGPEFHVECYGSYNTIIFARWEAVAPKVRFNGDQAYANVIMYGAESHILAVTEVNGARRNQVYRAYQQWLAGSGVSGGRLVLTDTESSDHTAITMLASNAVLGTTDPDTAYAVRVGANLSHYKRSGDAANRIELEHRNARINFGGGTLAVDVTLERDAADRLTLAAGDAFRVGAIAALPEASASWRGYLYRVEGDTGVADGLYICAKNMADGYEWKLLS